MAQKIILTDKAPSPVGPYSQAIEVNGTIYCSGQIALDPATGQMVGKTPAEQTAKLMDNMRAVLEAAGVKMTNIVKTSIFLLDMGAFADVNKVYEEKLGGHKPARSTVAVSALPKGALVEIECVAVR